MVFKSSSGKIRYRTVLLNLLHPLLLKYKDKAAVIMIKNISVFLPVGFNI
jgi:hypothetical protein